MTEPLAPAGGGRGKSVETRTTVQTLGEDGILYVTLKPGAVVTLADAEANHAATIELMGDRRFLVLVDIRQARSLTREARRSFSDPEKRKNTIAQALLVDSGISRVMGNFFIGLHKSALQVKLFTSPAEALDWLREFVK